MNVHVSNKMNKNNRSRRPLSYLQADVKADQSIQGNIKLNGVTSGGNKIKYNGNFITLQPGLYSFNFSGSAESSDYSNFLLNFKLICDSCGGNISPFYDSNFNSVNGVCSAVFNTLIQEIRSKTTLLINVMPLDTTAGVNFMSGRVVITELNQ